MTNLLTTWPGVMQVKQIYQIHSFVPLYAPFTLQVVYPAVKSFIQWQNGLISSEVLVFQKCVMGMATDWTQCVAIKNSGMEVV